MKKLKLLTVVLGGLVFVSAGCGHIIYADGPYRGKVIDRETKQPIEGAAVLAVWWKETPAPHPIITYYDAQETLTDKEGNFTITGIVGGAVNPLAKIREPLFTIFKPGYEVYEDRRLAPHGKEGVTVLKLRRLITKEERLKNLRNVSVSTFVPKEKYPSLMRLENIERSNLGLE